MKKFICFTLLFLACSEMKIKWAKKFDVVGQGNYRINDLCVMHNIYVSGVYWQTDQNFCCITAEYNKNGNIEWFTIYERPNLKAAEGKAILKTEDGIYVLLQAVDVNNAKDVTLVKYDGLGNIEWERVVEKSPNEIVGKMLSDNTGNIYVAGWTTDAKNSITIFVAKYRQSGELVWLTTYYNPILCFNHLKFDIMKPEQFVIGGILDDSQNFFFVKCDSLGRFSGLTKCETTENERILADIKIDEQENVYLSGASSGNGQENDYLTVAYDKYDNLLWAERFDGKAHLDDIPKAMAVDESANVYVTGSSKNAQGKTEIVTIKYEKNGSKLWIKEFSSGKDKSAEPYFLHPGFLRCGKYVMPNLYIIGTVGDDVALLKYNTSGGDFWAITYRRDKGINHIPTAFFSQCLAVQNISEKESEAIIVKYERAEQFGFARWD